MTEKNTKQSLLKSNDLHSKTKGDIARVEKVLLSIKQLFQPFKDIVVAIMPASSKIVKGLDLIGYLISKTILFIANIIPRVVTFIKGKAFKVIIVALLLVFISNAVISRLLSGYTYKSMISKAVKSATGYDVNLEGDVGVNLLTFSITFNKAKAKINQRPEEVHRTLYLSRLEADQVSVNFSYLQILLGHLKIKNLHLIRANIDYKSDKFGSNTEYTSLNDIRERLDQIAKVPMVLPNVSSSNTEDSAENSSLNFIDQLSNLSKDFGSNISRNSKLGNKSFQSPFIQDNKKYMNLDGVLVKKQKIKHHKTSIINPNSSLFALIHSLVKRVSFDLTTTKNIKFRRSSLTLLSANSKQLISLHNLNGLYVRSIKGNYKIMGEGEMFNDLFYFQLEKNKGAKHKFILDLSYNDPSLKNKDLTIQGYSGDKFLKGKIKANNIAFTNLANSFLFDTKVLNQKKASFTSSFYYRDSVLNLPDIKLKLGSAIQTASIWMNMTQHSIIKVNLNLKIPSIDNFLATLIPDISKDSHLGYLASISDSVIAWHNSKGVLANSIVDLSLNFTNTNLNSVPIQRVSVSAFLDSKDNLYVPEIMLSNNDFSLKLSGKLALPNKSGVFIAKSKGSIASLCNYSLCKGNLYKLLNKVALDQDGFKLSGRLFVNDNRVVFNDLKGNFGARKIKSTSATYINRGSRSELDISSSFDALKYSDFTNIYGFNKSYNSLYYNDNDNFTGIPSNLDVKLSIYSSKVYFDQLVFKDLTLDMSLSSSGIMLHSFSANDSKSGVVKGSFNFNNMVYPAIVGNINFNNVFIDMQKIHNVFFSKYNIIGRVILNGSLNFSGKIYYQGVSRVNGELSIFKYERFRIHKNNKINGFYLTVAKKQNTDGTTYNISDIYSDIIINNNLIELSPAIVRYINSQGSYRGQLSGKVNLISKKIDLHSLLSDESDDSSKGLKLILQGSISDVQAYLQ